MEQQAWKLAEVPPARESLRQRRGAPVVLTLEVNDPEVLAELRRHQGEEQERYALAALRVGVLALRTANGHVDASSIREAGQALVGEVRELLSTRATEMTERMASTLTQYLDPQSGLLPQRLQSLTSKDGELDRLLRAHVGADDSQLAKSLAAHLGAGSPIFQLLSPTDAGGLRMQLTKTLEEALAEQRTHILKEFSLDQEGSALSRLVSEFSLDADGSALNRLSKMMAATSDRIGKNLTLDDEASSLSRLKRELLGTIDQLAKSNVEFQAQVRESLARLDTRKREEARTTRHGFAFEERLGAIVSEEAQRLGDVYEATGETTGAIKLCKKGDCVVELGTESAAANARIVWEAKEKQQYTQRSALAEIEEARRNRQAQVGVFVFSRKTAPEGIEALRRYGSDVVVVWDAEDPASDVVVKAAYSLARALAVREHRTDEASQEVIAELEKAARSVERQIAFVDDVKRMAETVKSHGEKIADRSGRMVEELRRSVESLDAQVATLRRTDAPPGVAPRE
ncbi:MAG TPA: hypothetical protein VGG39_29665 [Polyangiaceae bacterium]|jgi:hypothetical protein